MGDTTSLNAKQWRESEGRWNVEVESMTEQCPCNIQCTELPAKGSQGVLFWLLPVSHHEVLSSTMSEICLRAQMKVARNPRHKPDFSKAFHHIAVHPGARVVIDRIATVRGPRAYIEHVVLAAGPRAHACAAEREGPHIKAGHPVYNTTLNSGKPNTILELKPSTVPCTAERGAHDNLTRPGFWCAHDLEQSARARRR